VRLLLSVALAAAMGLTAAAAAAAQTPIAGGGSFNDAPVLEPGSYADTLRGGEQLFYGVKLEPGQSVTATATVEGRSTTSYFMDLKLYSALRKEIGEGSEPFGQQDRRVELRAESEPAEQPGIHFISIAAREGGKADAPEQFDTRIEFRVTGQAATPTPTPTASAKPAATAAPGSGGGGSGLPVGAIVLGLAVGLVAGFGGRRALARR
jgi:hypothetical protein